MLFDLRSPKRRRFIQVTFGTLAAVFAISFVFFGVGSEVQGGFADIFTSGGGDTGQEDAIEDAEERLETNPNDAAALAELVQARFQSGTSRIEIDEETGEQRITSEAEQDLLAAADAWDRYLKLTGNQADPSTALLAVQTFATLAQGKLSEAAGGTGPEALTDAEASLANWKGAADAQRVVASQRGDADSFSTLATLLFSAGEFEQGRRAADRAVAAAKGNQGTQIRRQLDQAEQQARQITAAIADFRQQLAQAGAGAPGGENPLSEVGGGGLSGGGLGGGGLSTP